MDKAVTDIARGWAETRERVAQACAKARRPSDSVLLLAVSKLKPAEDVRSAYEAGARAFGENYAQELRNKAEVLADLADLRWHAIGPLQINKAKYVAKSAFAFHALDWVDVAEELSRRRTLPPLECYLEVNLAGEESKGGVAPAQLEGLLQDVRRLPNLKVVGLMGLPPLGPDAEASRPYFRELAGLAKSVGVSGLSMGTTADFDVAIEEGATVVRVGTAIFGER